MPIPDGEGVENARKQATDQMVNVLMDVDRGAVRREVMESTHMMTEPYRIVVCGGAGSGKSTFSEELGSFLEIPSFDLDLYIQGGWTPNQKQYEHAFAAGMNELYSDIPIQRDWIIEHVEACGPEVRQLFKPKWAICLYPGRDHLKLISDLRDVVSGEKQGTREGRMRSSHKTAFIQFNQAPGKLISEGKNWRLKELK